MNDNVPTEYDPTPEASPDAVEQACARADTVIRLADLIETARYERDACGRAVARAVLRGDDHAVGLHAREFAAAVAELDRLTAELTGRETGR